MDKFFLIIERVFETTVLKKEIDKASAVVPQFTLKFCMDDLKSTYKELNYLNIFYCGRRLVDYYTVARILKNKMKHVIYYSGAAHSRNVVQILKKLSLDSGLPCDVTSHNDSITPHCFSKSDSLLFS